MNRPSEPQATARAAGTVTDHFFYLWDDTDEVTRTLCGVGCGQPPEAHISEHAPTASAGGEGAG